MFAPLLSSDWPTDIRLSEPKITRTSPRSATLISLSIIAGDCRFLHSLGRDPAVFHHSTVEQMHRAIGVLREPLIVRQHANGRAAGVQFLQHIHDGFTIAGVEVSGR